MRTITADEAYAQGVEASRVEAQASQHAPNPYDADTDSILYDAWDEGFNLDSDTYGEIAHLGL